MKNSFKTSLSSSLFTMWKRRGSDRKRAVLHNSCGQNPTFGLFLVIVEMFLVSRSNIFVLAAQTGAYTVKLTNM